MNFVYDGMILDFKVFINKQACSVAVGLAIIRIFHYPDVSFFLTIPDLSIGKESILKYIN